MCIRVKKIAGLVRMTIPPLFPAVPLRRVKTSLPISTLKHLGVFRPWVHVTFWKWKSLSHVRLCDLMDYTVHGILQARILERVAAPFSRGSSQPRDQTQVSCTASRFFTSWATREAWGFMRPWVHVTFSFGVYNSTWTHWIHLLPPL